MITTEQVQLFIKAGLVSDPDWSTLPEEPPADRQHAVRWRLENAAQDLQVPRLLIKITFRNALGDEVIGTCKLDALWRTAASLSAAQAEHRPAWGSIGEVTTAHSSRKYLDLNVGGDGVLTLRLYDINAAGATHVYVTAQQWGAS